MLCGAITVLFLPRRYLYRPFKIKTVVNGKLIEVPVSSTNCVAEGSICLKMCYVKCLQVVLCNYAVCSTIPFILNTPKILTPKIVFSLECGK